MIPQAKASSQWEILHQGYRSLSICKDHLELLQLQIFCQMRCLLTRNQILLLNISVVVSKRYLDPQTLLTP